MMSIFCAWQSEDHAETMDCLIAKPTSREQTNYILEGLAECLACAGATTEVYTKSFWIIQFAK